ncbi:hypothetical protein GGR50DRAFT_701562 [Xylaria sp. CBS 124048]|nr:hypothetical protein GGR50DRAFT_701562 [Xylaria sp. CBS 124048]
MEDSSEANTTIIVGAIVGVLAILAVIFRFYARYFKRTVVSWDDLFILLSIVNVIVIDAVDLYATNLDPNGAEVASSNGEIDYAPVDVTFTKIVYASTILYFPLTSTTKLSILFFYNRIFSVNPSFRRRVIAMMVVVTGFWIGTVVADLLNCIPLKYVWVNSLDDPRFCFNFNYFWLATGIVEALIDVLILLLPIPIVTKLQVKGSKRWGIVGVFLVGIFVIISGIVKTILSYMPNSREPSFYKTQLWTTVHSCTGIICACMPVCWPLLVSLGKVLRPKPQTREWFAKASLSLSWHSWGSRASAVRRLGNQPMDDNDDGFDLGASASANASDTRILRSTSV